MPILNPLYTIKKLTTFQGSSMEGYEAALYRGNIKVAEITEHGSDAAMDFKWEDEQSIKVKQEVYQYELRNTKDKLETLCTPEQAVFYQYLLDHFDDRGFPTHDRYGEADPEIWIMNEIQNMEIIDKAKETLKNICIFENGKAAILDASWDPVKRDVILASLSLLHPSATLINDLSLDEAAILLHSGDLEMKNILDAGLKDFLNSHLSPKAQPATSPKLEAPMPQSTHGSHILLSEMLQHAHEFTFEQFICSAGKLDTIEQMHTLAMATQFPNSARHYLDTDINSSPTQRSGF